jgi:hypothetical protein
MNEIEAVPEGQNGRKSEGCRAVAGRPILALYARGDFQLRCVAEAIISRHHHSEI